MTNITNMPELTINSRMVGDNKIPGVKDMLNIAHAIKDSVMLHGAPGIGKSQGVYQWNADKVEEYTKAGKKWNPVVCDVRLSMKEPVDMVGIPVLSKNEKGKTVTVWATPSMWPQGNEFDGGTIFLDEINQGQAAIQNAAFQLIQDRALGEYKVPELQRSQRKRQRNSQKNSRNYQNDRKKLQVNNNLVNRQGGGK